jgi:MFS family permease
MAEQQGDGKGWVVTFAGMGINLALGVLYTWSVIKKAIPADWGWDDAAKALPYSIACIVFALMMVPAGRLQDKIGPRWVATAGGILTGLGCILASFSTTLFWYVIGFGVLAGAGIGLGYASATPPAVKWFPAKRTGLIAGLVVAGFGLASVYISPLANFLTGNDLAGKPQGSLLAADTANKAAGTEATAAQWVAEQARALPGGTVDAAGVEALLAALTTAQQDAAKKLADARATKAANLVELEQASKKAEAVAKAGPTALKLVQAAPGGTLDAAGAEALAKSKKDAGTATAKKLREIKESNIHNTLLYFGIGFLIIVVILSQLLVAPPAGYVPAGAAAAGAAGAAAAAPINLSPGQMLRSPLFYLLWLMFACSSGAGLMIIGNITTIAKLGKIEAGFILVALLAVGNAGGRIIAGMLSDKIGRTWTMFIIFVLQAAMMMVLRTGLSEMAVFIGISMLLGFNYGACLSVFPSATKDNFGLKNFGVNYGLVFTSWGVGGFVFPLVAGKLFETAKASTGTGSYNDAYLVAAGALCLAAVLTFATRVVEKTHKAKLAAAK